MLRIHTAAAAAIVVFTLGIGVRAQRTTPVIRQVDHILVECSGNPESLFALFADTFQLPVAWPIDPTQSYVTGGIGLGDTNIEFFAYRERMSPASPAAHFYGIAFEPYPLADALKRLQSLQIPYDKPAPVVSVLPNGTRGVAWTTVALPSVSKPGMSIFLYEYSPAFLRVAVRREQLGNRLTLNGGGPLGFQSVSQILIASTRLKKDKEIWGLMLGKPASAKCFQLLHGPEICLEAGDRDGIRGIAVKVKSLDRAKAFLKKNRLLGPVAADRVYLSPSKLQGLSISLQDK